MITGNICESGCSGGWLYFFAGRGDGSFAAPKKRVTTVAPLALASSDFNKDGLDFLLLGSEAHVFLNRGGGRFRELTYPSVSGSAMTLGDLNGDGVQDVAYVDGIGAGVMLGRPNGAFKPLSRFAVPFPAYGLAIGDFNADGKSDVAVSDYDSSMYGSISLLLGTTDGTLQAAQEYVVPSTAMSFLVSDVNGDGMQDVLVGSSGILGANLSVLIARGYHNFASPANYPLTGGPRELAVADFNHDGLHRCGCAMQRAEA